MTPLQLTSASVTLPAKTLSVTRPSRLLSPASDWLARGETRDVFGAHGHFDAVASGERIVGAFADDRPRHGVDKRLRAAPLRQCGRAEDCWFPESAP